MMSSVQKDNFYQHNMEKLENVSQLSLDKSPVEKSTQYLNQHQTAAKCKWQNEGKHTERLLESEPATVTLVPEQFGNANVDQSPQNDDRSYSLLCFLLPQTHFPPVTQLISSVGAEELEGSPVAVDPQRRGSVGPTGHSPAPWGSCGCSHVLLTPKPPAWGSWGSVPLV